MLRWPFPSRFSSAAYRLDTYFLRKHENEHPWVYKPSQGMLRLKGSSCNKSKLIVYVTSYGPLKPKHYYI